MTEFEEPPQVKLTGEAKEMLRAMKENGHFTEMAHGFRFAVGLALQQGGIAAPDLKDRSPIYGVDTIDGDKSLKTVVRLLRDKHDEPVYFTIERLAEWGIRELYRLSETGTVNFGAMFPDPHHDSPREDAEVTS